MNDQQIKKKPPRKPQKNLTIFSDDQIQQVETLSGFCLKVPEIAAVMKISESTFYEVAKRQPQVSEALRQGRAKVKATISQSLIKNAAAGDYKSQAFYLARQAGWIDKSEKPVEQNVTFVVEMSEHGKFKTARPREVKKLDAIDVDFEGDDDG